MKTFYKIAILALAVCGALESCQKSAPYEPGKPAGQYDVCFSDLNPGEVALDLSATSFDVVLERTNASGALTIPVTLWTDVEGIATAPETVTFADGSKKATLTVTLGNIDPFVEFQAELVIPDEYCQPYKDDAGYPRYGFVFYKEDYVPYASCSYFDAFWYEDEWEEVIYYSSLLKQYRINAFPGGAFYFKWDGDKKVSYASKAAIATGYVDKTYGAVTATPTSCGWSADDDAFVFVFEWTVSAGSFGEYPQYVYNIEKL